MWITLKPYSTILNVATIFKNVNEHFKCHRYKQGHVFLTVVPSPINVNDFPVDCFANLLL